MKEEVSIVLIIQKSQEKEKSYIMKSIDSIIAQTYPAEKLDVILVGVSTSQKLLAFLDSYKREHPSWQIIRDSNLQTVGAARNAATKAAKVI